MTAIYYCIMRLLLLCSFTSPVTVSSFVIKSHASATRSPTDLSAAAAASRRQWLMGASTLLVTAAPWIYNKNAAAAVDVSSIVTKEFVDPKGLFSITVPQHYFTLRRSAPGDLPDEKTGRGRRGSSIFTAGDMQKAELVAIERCVC
jgi:hypothetical protein